MLQNDYMQTTGTTALMFVFIWKKFTKNPLKQIWMKVTKKMLEISGGVDVVVPGVDAVDAVVVGNHEVLLNWQSIDDVILRKFALQ